MKFGENISDYENNLLHFLMPFAQWLGSWNSCIDPILTASLNKKFREIFKSLLSSCSCRSRFISLEGSRQAAYRSANGTIVGFNRTTSCTSVYILGKSGCINRRFSRHCSQNSSYSSWSLFVNNFRGTEKNSTRRTTTSVVIRNTVTRAGTRKITDL